MPLSKFKRRFPEGTYRFAGRTIEGKKQVGKGRLSHKIPNGPEILAPAEDSTVPDGDVDARWAPAPRPGIEIEGCRVIVERENPFRLYQVELPASTDERHDPVRISRAGHRVPARDSDDRAKRKPDLHRALFQRASTLA